MGDKHTGAWSLLGMAAAGIAFGGASRFGKSLLLSATRSLTGPEGVGVMSKVLKSTSLGGSLLPFIGPPLVAARQIMAGGANWKMIGNFKSSWKTYGASADEALVGRSPLRSSIREFVSTTYPGLNPRKSAKKVLEGRSFFRSLKTNPRQALDNLNGSWENTMGAAMPIQLKNNAEKYIETLQQAEMSKKLMYTALGSNLAAVAIPTMASSLATYAIGRSMYRKTKNRLRGYDAE